MCSTDLWLRSGYPRWWILCSWCLLSRLQHHGRLKTLEPATLLPPIALLSDFVYLPGMPGVIVELAISGLMTIFHCNACCDMCLIIIVSCCFQMLFSL